MEKRIAKATYQFEIPFLFCGKEYFNSADLAHALVEHWDLGLMAARRGELAAFFDYHAEFNDSFKEIAEEGWSFFSSLHDAMKSYYADTLYSEFLCQMEKNLPGVPIIRFGELKGEIIGKEEWEEWSIGKDETQENYRGSRYDAKEWDNYLWSTYYHSGVMRRFFFDR